MHQVRGPYSHMYGKIFGTHPVMGQVHIADVRGWGYLTGGGHRALGLSNEEGKAAQDKLGDDIAAALNSQNN